MLRIYLTHIQPATLLLIMYIQILIINNIILIMQVEDGTLCF
jgi:hypothetical protein